MGKNIYHLKTHIRGVSVHILKGTEIVGRATNMLAFGWVIRNKKDKFIAVCQKKENIILIYKMRKNLPIKPRKPRLCLTCPYRKRRH